VCVIIIIIIVVDDDVGVWCIARTVCSGKQNNPFKNRAVMMCVPPFPRCPFDGLSNYTAVTYARRKTHYEEFKLLSS